MTWQKVRIKDIVAGLYDGPHATPKPSNSGLVFLGIKNITPDGKIDLSGVRHIADEDLSRWTKRIVPQEGDIVFSYEATLNLYAMIPKGFRGCLGRRMALIRPNSNTVDGRFLYYYFFSPIWREEISKHILSGSTVDRIPLSKFPDFSVYLPPLTEQKKIADTISAYDELIENNNKRINILEQMAEALYKEWFVNHRFPGHEKVRLVESGTEFGRIPEGWEVVTMGKAAIFMNGYPFKPSELGSAGLPIIKIPELRSGITTKTPRNHGNTLSKKYLVYDRDILFSWSGTLLVNIWNSGEALLNQHLFKVTPRENYSRAYTYLTLTSLVERIKKHVVGATMQHLRKDTIESAMVIMPGSSILALYEKIAGTAFDQIAMLHKQNKNLTKSQGMLLGRSFLGIKQT